MKKKVREKPAKVVNFGQAAREVREEAQRKRIWEMVDAVTVEEASEMLGGVLGSRDQWAIRWVNYTLLHAANLLGCLPPRFRGERGS